MFDIDEYERIVNKYGKELYSYCYFKSKNNESLAEEAFNDTLKLLYEKWDTLDRSGNIRAYLYRVADILIRHHKKEYHKYYSYNDSLEEAVENNLLDHLDHVDTYFQGSGGLEDEYIEHIKNSIPEEYRDLFVYRYIEKKTIAETAALVGLPTATCRFRLQKLEALVKEEIEKIFNKF